MTENIKLIDEKAPNNKQQNQMNKKHNSENEGIYVRGYSAQTKENDLVKYFSQFGNVVWVHFGHDFLLLDFTEQSAVEKVLSKKSHFLSGNRLFVRRKESRRNTVVLNDEEVNKQIYEYLISELKNIHDFNMQVSCMKHNLQPDMNECYQKYSHVCRDLCNIISSSFPYVQVYPFGSTFTGLDFNNSDIDVYLANVKQSDEDEVDLLKIIKVALSKSRIFANCFCIPSAKIPIVKCIHTKTKIRCDINIKNMLGVCNSKLIRYYLGIDPKINDAMIILKYWAKFHKITGQNHLFTSYSLILMFIFFLQQEPYNLPSVSSLQIPEKNHFLEIQGYWNGGFIEKHKVRSEKISNTSLQEIVENFFGFYSNFNFATTILCPYTGKSLPINYFQDYKGLPHIFKRYKDFMSVEENKKMALKTNTCICIQDPFELNRNVVSVVTESVVEKFTLCCQIAKKIFSEKNQTLYRLYTEEPVQMKKVQCSYQEDSLDITLHRSTTIKYLPNNQNDEWFETASEFVLMTLRDFLDLDLTAEDSQSKMAKSEEEPTVHGSGKSFYVCMGKYNMWDARKATAKKLNLPNTTEMTVIEKETKITNNLKEVYNNISNSPIIVQFRLMLEKRNDALLVHLEKINAYKKSFKSFCLFFAHNMPQWFEMYEKELNKRAIALPKT
ncbi:speckle targeted PIP5K1A-regulated poly(A) polymerase-like isoform X1 [Sitophilus oryzae]|uniref:Speckle targeted PIP5K1A-regulated poly(A) polymerase n=1 Tax=Sitophilus oryzae TaxID=7048 RepID=A0A6J2YKH7_SITOR|nr:speckle targeted PIP5K1A-regulated poly(A) polymerase-like isoform X1 [Sitophilus oryzae]XP_030763800.1 speckle targeted PIP5K1A-regulated poly(A) polymerase-like isoform X1 [Sitophilus oryzae]XP_030763801.1 speckle targeted PIP5K1A-regulated poly(A) polymerase-like isoform X1 [Sitophilus oryzae]XP_030763802.1 speckle targeted PIP5K1A-regulated poly(A) polymerase-like isoform X1 [Sitophilus oryzae]